MPKILIIRFSSIGDIVLTTPVVRCIRQQVPGAEVHFLIKEQYAMIVEHNPHIAKTYAIKKRIREVLPALKKERYDFIVDLHHNLRTLGVKYSLCRPWSAFPKVNLQKWLLVRFKINTLPEKHLVERYFQAVRRLGVSNDRKGLEYFIPDGEWVALDHLPMSHRSGYIALVIGARHQTKMMPVDKITALCRALSLPVILLGGQEDHDRGEKIASMAGTAVFNACGLYSLHQSASVIARASQVITHDTGLMHVAAAFRKRIISVWGNTVPAFGMFPYLPCDSMNLSSVVEVGGLKCRPCSKLGFTACPKNHFRCMNDIDEAEIVRLANRKITPE